MKRNIRLLGAEHGRTEEGVLAEKVAWLGKNKQARGLIKVCFYCFVSCKLHLLQTNINNMNATLSYKGRVLAYSIRLESRPCGSPW